MDDNEIVQFYNNKTILITGATGFLGKVLVEKLLRCFNPKKILLLIRTKNNASIEERLATMLSESLYCKIRENNPDVFSKLVPIHVDYTTNDLNLNEESKLMINEEVEIVFNSVASVKFNERLKDAIDINILGTEKIINLVKGIRNLKVLMHVSTLYANCARLHIEEKLYDAMFTYQELITLSKVLNRLDNEKLEPIFLEGLPNTYTFSKHYSEKMVSDLCHNLPCGIFRPPVVMGVYNDPVPGYTDNVNGPSGIVAWTVRGFIHTIWGNKNNRANIVPVDYCINAMLAATWEIYENSEKRLEKNENVPIYNYIYKDNNITWGQYMSLIPLGFHQPLEKFIWYYSYTITDSETLFNITSFFVHILPGFLMDVMSFIIGKKMIYTKAYQKTQEVLKTMAFFGRRQWVIENPNIERLTQKVKKMKNYNKELEFDLRIVDWKKYFTNYIPGFRAYYYKEDPKKAQKTAEKYQRMKMIHLTLKYGFYLVVLSKIGKLSKKGALKLIMKFNSN